MLFTPWVCGGPLLCGNSSRFRHMLARCGCSDRATESRDASQLAEVSATLFTFERAWRLRCSEIHVLAARADTKCHAARKHLVMEDTTLFATLREPREAIRQGEDIKKFKCFTMPIFESGTSFWGPGPLPRASARRALGFALIESFWRPIGV